MGALVHLAARDTSFAVISRAPIAKIEPFKKRMGWRFPWVSSYNSDFNCDFNVSFTPEQIAAGRPFYNYDYGNPGLEDLSGDSVFFKVEANGRYHQSGCACQVHLNMETT